MFNYNDYNSYSRGSNLCDSLFMSLDFKDVVVKTNKISLNELLYLAFGDLHPFLIALNHVLH